MRHFPFPSLTVTAALAVASATLSSGAGVLVSVPGTSDPWLAGMPDGTPANFNDIAPDQSPVEVTGLGFAPGDLLVFTAAGEASNGPCCTPIGPDGGSLTSHAFGAEHGKSDVVAPLNALLGVFLDDSQPDTTPAPPTLDFSGAGLGTSFAVLSPALKQVFFIGDGLDGNGNPQCFEVPSRATRLFLGTMDGFEWNNNFGALRVQVDLKTPVVPEAQTLLAGGGLVALLALQARRRTRV